MFWEFLTGITSGMIVLCRVHRHCRVKAVVKVEVQ